MSPRTTIGRIEHRFGGVRGRDPGAVRFRFIPFFSLSVSDPRPALLIEAGST